MADKIKIGVALLLVAAGIAGFYYLQQSPAVLRLVLDDCPGQAPVRL
jgi:hypothetical protein